MVPIIKTALHPQFMSDCSRTIIACKNLASFTCTPNVLPSFLLALQGKGSLKSLRANPSLTTDQAMQLVKIKGLQTLALDGGSWNTVDVLPGWMETLGPTLTTLILHVCIAGHSSFKINFADALRCSHYMISMRPFSIRHCLTCPALLDSISSNVLR